MIWESFIAGFCQVEFLCYSGHPNWLGWIVLAIGGVIAMFVLAAILILGYAPPPSDRGRGW